MLRALPLLAALAVIALVGVAGPAFSAKPYVPDPVEFDLRAPAAQPSIARGGRSFVSPPLRAPKRFNLLGLRWRGSAANVHLHVRVRRDGGRWSKWHELQTGSSEGPDRGRGEPVREGVSSPAWAGQADWVQYRSKRRLAGVRLQFVNTTGTATAADRRRTALGRAVNRGVIAATRLPGALVPGAHAAEEQPEMVARDGWGASKCPPRDAPSYGQVDLAFVHHTVNVNTYSREEAPAVVLAICRFHRNTRGWDDIGYNFLVDRFGTIYEGRAGGVDQPVMGAQAQGFNGTSTGIANIGNFQDEPQSDEAIDAMARLIRWKLPLHGVPTDGRVSVTSAGGSSNRYAAGRSVTFERISGHRDGNRTSCPGAALYAQLPELRRRVGDVAPTTGGQNATRLSVRLPGTIRYPNPVRVAGTLSGGGAGMTVYLQRMSPSGSFRSIAETSTGPGGSFEFAFRPSRRTIVRVRYPGSSTFAASQSPAATIEVKPTLTFREPPYAVRPRELITVPGTISPRKGSVRLQVQRRLGQRYRTVATVSTRVRRGRFRARLRLSRTGLYRMRVVFPGDARNRATRGRFATVRVSRRGVAPPPPASGTTGGEGGTAPR
jgi:hypothetical protein